MKPIQLISPVDGSVYAERMPLSRDAAIAAAARARAALDGRDYVIPDDVKALAAPALRHRLVLSPAAEIEGRNVEQVIADIVEREDVPR